MKTLAFVDIDGTLAFSARAIRQAVGREPDAEEYVCVDKVDGKEVAWASRATVQMLQSLPVSVVPTTSRSVEQLLRMTLMAPTQWAIVAAGGTVLRDGCPDAAWEAEIRQRCRQAAPIDEVQRLLRGLVATARGARMLVAKTESDNAASALAAAAHARIRTLGWSAASDGRRVYLLPQPVTKAAAAAWVSQRSGATIRLAAGDSELDRTLLEWADFAMIPAHSHAAMFALHLPRARITDCGGPQAAEQMCEWMTRQTWSGRNGGNRGPSD